MCIKIQLLHSGYCDHHIDQIHLCDAVRYDSQHRICTGNNLFVEGFRVVKDMCSMCKETQVNKSAGLLFGAQWKGLSDPTGSGGKDVVLEVVEGVDGMKLDEGTVMKV